MAKAKIKKTYSTIVEYKKLSFEVEYDYNEGYFDREQNEQFQAQVFICGVYSQGDELVMTSFELADIAELVEKNHADGKYK